MENFDPQVSSLIINLIQAAVLALIGILAFGAKKLVSLGAEWLELKMGTEKYTVLKSYATTVVRAIAQSPATKDMVGWQKFQMASGQIASFAQSKGFDIDAEDVGNLIEEAVQIMKTELGENHVIWDLLEDEAE